MGQQQPDYDALARRFNGQAVPDYDALAQQAQQPAQPPASPTSRFFSNAWDVVNPMQILEGLNALLHNPVQTGGVIAQQQMAEAQKALDLASQGRAAEASGHGTAAMIPVLGPMAAQAGEQIASGDVAGGLGRGTGLLVPSLIPPAFRAGTKAVGMLPNRAAGALEAGAEARVADVMSPKVGANKVRFGNSAEKVAPELLRRGDVDGLSREGLHGNVQVRLAEAEQKLDAATDARLSARTFNTQPIVADLLKKRAALTAESVEGSRSIPRYAEQPGAGGTPTPAGPVRDIQSGRMKPTLSRVERPIGEDVVPAPNEARVAQIDQAIEEIRRLGPAARYESLRRIRAAYDQPAKVKYNPSMTQDFLKAQGGASGAADVTGVLREHLAKFDPETAAANADYAVYRRANDVLEATREVERTRPRVGRQMVARWAGAAAGGEAAGVTGAVTGYLLGPVFDSLTNMGVTTKLQTAKLMSGLADAIRTGNTSRANGLAAKLRRMTQATIVSRSTNPSERQAAPTGTPVPQGSR